MNQPVKNSESAANLWPPIARFVSLERRLAERAAAGGVSAFVYEFLRFGVKQGWACLFGAIMLALIIGTRYAYPDWLPIYRYDFLFLSALTVQAILLSTKLETWEEAKVILLYHVTGTVMEIFKTSVGSWIYPEPAFFRIGGVPLFTGFMYSCIGSYLCRAWRLFDFKFTRHPPLWALILLSIAIYINFFSHHYVLDMRIALFAVAAIVFARTQIYFKVWRSYRSMPLLLGMVLVTLFIWLSENIGTFTRTWVYSSQLQGWSLVSFGKFGSWFLLLLISYTMVALINRPENWNPEVAPSDEAGAPQRDDSLNEV